MTHHSAAVQKAMADVRASKSGTALFDYPKDAYAFEEAVYAKYNPDGYGTLVTVKQFDSQWLAVWTVGSAD